MSRTGRNEPCPCGSGRKYKKCCYPKERERWLAARRPPPEPEPSLPAPPPDPLHLGPSLQARSYSRPGGRSALRFLLGTAALALYEPPPRRYEISDAARAAYLAHSASCARCSGADAKVPGEERCSEGMRIVIEGLEGA